LPYGIGPLSPDHAERQIMPKITQLPPALAGRSALPTVPGKAAPTKPLPGKPAPKPPVVTKKRLEVPGKGRAR